MTNDFENNAPDTAIVDGVKNELNEIDATDVSDTQPVTKRCTRNYKKPYLA